MQGALPLDLLAGPRGAVLTARGCISPLGQKEDDRHANIFLLFDFRQRGFAPLPKIKFLLRPVGAPEIFAPVLKRTPGARVGCGITDGGGGDGCTTGNAIPNATAQVSTAHRAGSGEVP
jgi:hypothetical protein